MNEQQIQIQKSKIELTENQLKVIKDKYLKDSPTVEDWLYGIATNVALGDILHIPGVNENQIFDGVKITKEITEPIRGNISKVYLFHKGINEYNIRNDNIKKFLENLKELATTDIKCKNIVEETAQKFYNLMSNFEFLPNSPTLMNAGRDLQQLSACFREDQPIMTANGIKPIIEIKQGDRVLTASGNYKEVTHVMQRFVESYRVIDVWKLPNKTLRVTDEHPILCLDKESKKPIWKLAGNLQEEDFVAVSYPKQIVDLKKLEVINYMDSKFVVHENKIYKLNKDKRCPRYNKQIKPVYNEIDVDADLMKIFGYFLSEGDIDGRDSVRFTFNSDELEYMEDVIYLMKKKFGLGSKIEKSNSGHWSNVRFHSIILVGLFEKILGKGFSKKRVPSWILTLPKEKQKGLLFGLLRGDGYSFQNRHNTNIKAVLSNKDLVYCIWAIFARLGILSSFKKNNLQKLSTTNSYTCQLNGFESGKLFNEIFVGREFKGLSQLNMRRVKCLCIGEMFYLPIKNITVVFEPTTVYNFEVEGEHTYVANNIAVHNCYVLPVEDSIEGWLKAVTSAGIIHKSGGGTGFSVSRVRPKGSNVKSTKGVASGPLSPLRMIDGMTAEIKQGGQRRGANMGILSVHHPDIKDFISIKKTPGQLENFNISVAIDDEFMEAVRTNSEYDLIDPNTNKVVRKESARKIWDEMVKGAWETGDPGFVVIDRINNTDSNPTPHLGLIESTNPCGEQPLLPNEPCFAPDTLITTKGGLETIEGLYQKQINGEKIIIATDNIVDSRVGIEFKPCLVSKTGYKKIVEVNLNNGQEIKVTPNHQIFTTKGWKRAEKLTREDEVFIQSSSIYQSVDEGIVSSEIVEESLLGWLCGDGWFTRGKRYSIGICFGQEETFAQKKLIPLFKKYFNCNSNSYIDKNDVIQISTEKNYAVEKLIELGLKPGRAPHKEIPDYILTTKKEKISSYLGALFSADGEVSLYRRRVRFTSASPKLIKQVQLLLLNFGIKSRRSKNSIDKRVWYELAINGESYNIYAKEIGFPLAPRKQELMNIRNVQIRRKKEQKYSKVLSVREVGFSDVYDITEPETHSLIANGMVVHNCNLGSINLSKFIRKDGSDFDWERLKDCVWNTTHFLDNVIEVNNYPLEEIEEISKKNRRIGLGVMGWAESLVLLNLPYSSQGALDKAEKVMHFINDNCLFASIELGNKRGIFFNYRNSIFDPDGEHFRGHDLKPRNCARTTIAPTGTIGITAGLQGAGIEPFFAIAYTRYNAKGIDCLKEGKTPPAECTFWEINPLFKEIAKKNNFFGLKEEELWKKVEKNHKSVKGIEEIPEKIQDIFLTSHDLEPKDHILMQAAFQKYTNNAVSKTINLRNEATIEDVEECYMLAYDNGCKGVTIYRDGSKQFQVLNLSDKKVEKKEETKIIYQPKIRIGKGEAELSTYYKVPTGYGDLHMHINYDDEGPLRIFANISPTGTEVSGLTCVIGILLSKYFEYGGDPIKVLKHLNSIKGDKPYGFGTKRIDSIPHAMAQALRDHLIKTGKLAIKVGGDATQKDDKKQLRLDVEGHKATISIYCPQCYSSNVEMVSGCSEPTCFDCGFSKCS